MCWGWGFGSAVECSGMIVAYQEGSLDMSFLCRQRGVLENGSRSRDLIKGYVYYVSKINYQ